MNKNIKTWNQFINEDISEKPEQRFDRAIYLTYVGLHLENEFKHVTEKEFYDRLYFSKLDKQKTTYLDKTNKYRIADSKIIWLDKYNNVLGEVWVEGDLKSYWVKVK